MGSSRGGRWIAGLVLLAAAIGIWLLARSALEEDPADVDSPPSATEPRPAAGKPAATKRARSEGAAEPAPASSQMTSSLSVRLVAKPDRADLAQAVVWMIDAIAVEHRATAGPSRTVEFTGLPSGGCLVRVECASMRCPERKVQLEEDKRTEIELAMYPQCFLTGVVRDPRGEAVGGAWVHVGDENGTSTTGHDANADDDGRYRVGGLSPGARVSVTAGFAGFGDALPVAVGLPREPGATAEQNVTLQEIASLAITVIDPSGTAVDALIRLDGQWQTKYDPGRREHVAAKIQPGNHVIQVEAPGSPPLSQSVFAAAGTRTAVDVRLATGAEISGVVVDTAGRPVASVAVMMNPRPGQPVEAPSPPMSGVSFRRPVVSGADGSFRFDGLSSGREVELLVQGGEKGMGMTVATAPAKDVRIVLQPKTQIRFRLAPAPGAGMRNVEAGACPPGTPPNTACDVAQKGGFASGRVDPGQVIVCDVTPDARALFIGGEGFAPLVVAIAPEAGGMLDLGEIRVGPGTTIRGRVIGSDGKGLANTDVATGGRSSSARRAGTDLDGRFELENVADGAMTIRASRAGRQGAASVVVSGGIGEVTIRCSGIGTLRGSVRDAAGAPIAGAGVLVRYGFVDGETDSFLTVGPRTDANGAWSASVAAGRCVVYFGNEAQTKEVPEGGEVVVDLWRR